MTIFTARKTRRAKRRFPENLRRLRLERGLDQAELAARLDLQNTSVCNWERGLCVPPPLTLKCLALVLHVTPADLLGVEIED